ncbi:hypothetical protein [Fundidesulfovibrio terrae]|uniref:hypothetical protein n=1 Tax=Fundidesulfovibrio terrae TaxID=2922866 RepID=UPI001FAF6C5F|nr:hypothetical protein [Fundidesulfovibrio terrae]
MKTLALVLALAALSCPALAAPLGTQTSQSTTLSVNVDSFAYRLTALMNLANTAQGMSVSVGPGNLQSVAQPAGPVNNSSFFETFTIPMSVINFFY